MGISHFTGLNVGTQPNTNNADITEMLFGSAALDFPSIAAASSQDLTITVTGAVIGDLVFLGVPNASVLADVFFTAWVSAADTVTVRATNNNASVARDPASGTFKAMVVKAT